jgi:hypothetical protein
VWADRLHVYVRRNLQAGVPQQFLNDLGVLGVGIQERSKSMPNEHTHWEQWQLEPMMAL